MHSDHYRIIIYKKSYPTALHTILGSSLHLFTIFTSTSTGRIILLVKLRDVYVTSPPLLFVRYIGVAP